MKFKKMAANAKPAATPEEVNSSQDTSASTPHEEKIIQANRYKTKLCRSYVATGECPYEVRCMFAHGKDEIRTCEENLQDGLVTEEAIKAFRCVTYTGEHHREHERHGKDGEYRRPNNSRGQHHKTNRGAKRGQQAVAKTPKCAGVPLAPPEEDSLAVMEKQVLPLPHLEQSPGGYVQVDDVSTAMMPPLRYINDPYAITEVLSQADRHYTQMVPAVSFSNAYHDASCGDAETCKYFPQSVPHVACYDGSYLEDSCSSSHDGHHMNLSHTCGYGRSSKMCAAASVMMEEEEAVLLEP